MSSTPLLSIGEGSRPILEDPQAEAFRVISRQTLNVLANICRAEAVEGTCLTCDCDDPAEVRREVAYTLLRLGFLQRQGNELPDDQRSLLELLRRALPTDTTSLALIHVLRALQQTNVVVALEEIEQASRWARLAVLSPL